MSEFPTGVVNSGGSDFPLPTVFLWTELNRRIDVATHRIDSLDQHGTRGVEALRLAFQQLEQDIRDHEATHQVTEERQANSRRWLIGTVVSLLVPLYPLIGWVLIQGR